MNRSHMLGYHDQMLPLGPAIRHEPEPTPEQMAAEIRRAVWAAFEAMPEIEVDAKAVQNPDDGWISWRPGNQIPVGDVFTRSWWGFETTIARPSNSFIWSSALVAYKFEHHKTSSDGWIDWNGGDCPVPADTRIEFRMRNGFSDAIRFPEFLCWGHRGWVAGGDIVAYRVAPL